MKKITLIIGIIFTVLTTAPSRENDLAGLNFLLGKWQGTGTGFGNETSVIEAEFISVMNGQYINVKHDSRFAPTESKPEGERHQDWGMISFDNDREKIVYRQFNIEGYVNQYVLNEDLSSPTEFIFVTEEIENFMKGGKARWTIRKINENEIETVFDVSFPGKEYTCFGTNKMKKIQD